MPNHRSKISRDDTHSECMARLLNHGVTWLLVWDGEDLGTAEEVLVVVAAISGCSFSPIP